MKMRNKLLLLTGMAMACACLPIPSIDDENTALDQNSFDVCRSEYGPHATANPVAADQIHLRGIQAAPRRTKRKAAAKKAQCTAAVSEEKIRSLPHRPKCTVYRRNEK